LANILATLDLLSGGRLICGAGLGGVPEEFGSFGEEKETKPRAEMLDEALEVIDRLMSGQVVDHHGVFYTVEGVTLAPLPLQRPRVPIWIGGESAPALRRAACWDGWVIGGENMEGEMVKTPEELARQIAVIQAHRRDSKAPFVFAITGSAGEFGSALTDRYQSAGATWWLETIAPLRGSLEETVNRIKAGPPR
jgi:alkanesulfonate monooxygenase SsuD/methylene tetrahydromethanopterin reductase-like flavin-dependent oxidoreductase (luciferase family)